MTPEARRSEIVSLVTEQGESSIEQLAHYFGVSLQTVRSDLRELTAQGLLLRRHGMVARALPQDTQLAVCTNNLHAATPLSLLQGCELTVSGGRVRKRDLDVIGSDALTFFRRYRVDMGVVSVGGIGEEGELYDFNDEEVVARQALVASAEVNVLVVDSTKFGRRAMCRNGDIGDFHYVVSDRAPTRQQKALLARRNTKWLCREE